MLTFIDHTQLDTPGRIPLNEWSARLRGRYLHNRHNRRKSMPSAGFETSIPAFEWLQTYALRCTPTGNCCCLNKYAVSQFANSGWVPAPFWTCTSRFRILVWSSHIWTVYCWPQTTSQQKLWYEACIKWKESRNRPGVAQRVPGGLGSQIFITFGTLKVVRSSASRTGRLYPQECSSYSFSLGDEWTPGPWNGRKEICHWKIQWHHRESIPGPSD